MPRYRSQRRNVYHICARCGTRQPLGKMEWQNGILICSTNGCVDREVVGEHDLKVAREVGIDRHELEPDPKLTNPNSRQQTSIEVLY